MDFLLMNSKALISSSIQKLIRMNMPISDDGTVHFTTTLLALIRESLSIKMGPGMCFVTLGHG
jgi:hypothetical protein